jgi:hypothetical protein
MSTSIRQGGVEQFRIVLKQHFDKVGFQQSSVSQNAERVNRSCCYSMKASFSKLQSELE